MMYGETRQCWRCGAGMRKNLLFGADTPRSVMGFVKKHTIHQITFLSYIIGYGVKIFNSIEENPCVLRNDEVQHFLLYVYVKLA